MGVLEQLPAEIRRALTSVCLAHRRVGAAYEEERRQHPAEQEQHRDHGLDHRESRLLVQAASGP